MTKSLFSELPLWKWFGILVLSSIVLALSVYLLAIWPHTAPPPHYEDMKPLEYFTMVNEKRRTAVQIVGGAFFFVTAFLTLRNVLAAEANAKIAREKHDQDRFVKATENLDNVNLSARIGAIYTLEQFGSISALEQSIVLDVLTAFLLQKCPLPDNFVPDAKARQGGDIEAALKAVGYLRHGYNTSKSIIFKRCDFSNILITNSIAEGMPYRFGGFVFMKSCLFHAFLKDCDLQGIKFSQCDLRYAFFNNADCTNAIFFGCELEDTVFSGTILNGVDFRGADLSKTIGLTQQQLNLARTDENTTPPPGIKLPPVSKRQQDQITN